MFQHQGDILRELNDNKWSKVQHLLVLQLLVAHTFIISTENRQMLKFRIPQVDKPKSILLW